ncbi:unannotated protein [freshwater metagenome]|uniref:Unannotated protein n=1 Tax=freshwater metagenome TaxID=449393 RepID=A0A6J7HXY9_9ZZZZ
MLGTAVAESRARGATLRVVHYGALIINLRNIVDAMDKVAEANPIAGQPLPLRIPTRRDSATPG